MKSAHLFISETEGEGESKQLKHCRFVFPSICHPSVVDHGTNLVNIHRKNQASFKSKSTSSFSLSEGLNVIASVVCSVVLSLTPHPTPMSPA